MQEYAFHCIVPPAPEVIALMVRQDSGARESNTMGAQGPTNLFQDTPTVSMSKNPAEQDKTIARGIFSFVMHVMRPASHCEIELRDKSMR